ncbi:MAG: A/G-specific adenine glycosylase [Deltaproteobacteria bacterium]|nr:A/G-specific adenine glycosylase [Deltaproteobacteria bacterium]
MKLARKRLLNWYRANKRAMPWRETRDPYAIWISEAMLQQTRVETVIPYWERFLSRFPDVHALATADIDDVLGVWAGLGYYSRARNLQAAARAIDRDHGGVLPDDAETLQTLPGIGRYTAGAVASIAFDRPEPVLDGNVKRVLARWLGIREDVGRPATVERLWEEAEALARGPHPGDLNQALMELGATVCTPRAPRCEGCPVSQFCDARAKGDAHSLPIKARKKAARKVEAVAALVVRRGKALAVRRPSRGLLGGLWDLPGGDLAAGETPRAGLRRALRECAGLEISRASSIGTVEHVFTHRRLTLHVYRANTSTDRIRLAGFEGHRWLAPRAISSLPHASVTAKALELLVAPTAQPSN